MGFDASGQRILGLYVAHFEGSMLAAIRYAQALTVELGRRPEAGVCTAHSSLH